MRKLITLLLLLIVTWTTSSCVASSSNSSTKLESNPEIILVNSGEQPKFSRIVLIASGSFEIVQALGYENNVVGVGITEKVYNSNILQVTDGHDFNLEKVLKVKPELIIVDGSTYLSPKVNQQLAKLGVIKYELNYVNTVAGIEGKILEIANLLNTPIAGAELISKLNQDFVSEQIGIRVAFLYLRGNNSIYLIGGKGSGADDLISKAGGIDVGALKFTTAFTPLTPEAMVDLNPDVFLLMSKGLDSVGGLAGFTRLPGVAQTNGGKNNQVITVDDEKLLSFGIGTFDLVRELNQKLREIRESN